MTDVDIDFRTLETLFLALADKTRLKLLALVANGPIPVGSLVDLLGDSQPKVSRHLAYMRRAGIVSAERFGKSIFYTIKRPSDRVARHIFDAFISSIVAVRVDGRFVFVSQTPEDTDPLFGDHERTGEFPHYKAVSFDDEQEWPATADSIVEDKVTNDDEVVEANDNTAEPMGSDLDVFLL